MLINTLSIDPPVFNSSSFWASSYRQLEELYDSVYTGAVTTRTSTLRGFQEDPELHKHAFLDGEGSINTYGYSPHPLQDYLLWISGILERSSMSTKPFIISIAPSSVTELTSMLDIIQELRLQLGDSVVSATGPNTCRIGIEFNTSCPNNQGHWPPAYNPAILMPFLSTLKAYFDNDISLTIGLKLAPFVHRGQFEDLIKALTDLSPAEDDGRHYISFLSCTNTLGSNFMLPDQEASPTKSIKTSADPSGLMGGLGGKPIHTLSLGNVRMFKKLLSEHSSHSLQSIHIIGIGGVSSKGARERMVKAGASAVACATALGLHGVGVFKDFH